MASNDDAQAPAGERHSEEEQQESRKKKEHKAPWTPQEDDKIREMVGKLGLRRWCKMAKELPERSPKQIRERWHNQLDPLINREPWTVQVTT